MAASPQSTLEWPAAAGIAGPPANHAPPMSTPFPRCRVLIPLLLCFLASVGCSRSHVVPRESPVRPFLNEVATRLDRGQTREGLEILLGRKLSPSAWERAQHRILESLTPGAHEAAEQCSHNLAILQTTVELYRGDEEHGGGRLPSTLADLLRVGGTKSIPTCPAAGRDTYSAGYRVLAHGEGYRLSCAGNNHRNAGLKAGFPGLDSRFGPMVASDPTSSGFSARLHLEIGEITQTGSRYEVALRETLRADEPSPTPSAASSPAAGATASPGHPSPAAASPSRSTGTRAPQPGQTASSTRLTLEEVPGAPGTFRMVTAKESERTGTLAALTAACLEAVSSPPAATASRADCLLEMRHVACALEMYSSDHDGCYPQRLEQLVPRYLWRLSPCQGGGGGPLPVYRVSDTREQYDLDCRIHADVHLSTRPSAGGRASRGGASSGAPTRQDGHLGASP